MQEPSPVSRRRFLADLLAVGGGLLASVAAVTWLGRVPTVEAGEPKPPSTKASPKPGKPVKQAPAERDNRPLAGKPAPPVRPTPRPSASPSGKPKEGEHMPTPGRVRCNPAPPSPRPKK